MSKDSATEELADSAANATALSVKNGEPLDEWHVRRWFCSIDLEQAEDTFRVVEGILQARREARPAVKQRKRRSDAGVSRSQQLDEKAKELNERITNPVQH